MSKYLLLEEMKDNTYQVILEDEESEYRLCLEHEKISNKNNRNFVIVEVRDEFKYDEDGDCIAKNRKCPNCDKYLVFDESALVDYYEQCICKTCGMVSKWDNGGEIPQVIIE